MAKDITLTKGNPTMSLNAYHGVSTHNQNGVYEPVKDLDEYFITDDGTNNLKVLMATSAAGVYTWSEYSYDSTVLKDADIGTTVQAYDSTIVVDADISLMVESDIAGIDGADVVANIVSLTQVEYDAITTPDTSTLYVIVG